MYDNPTDCCTYCVRTTTMVLLCCCCCYCRVAKCLWHTVRVPTSSSANLANASRVLLGAPWVERVRRRAWGEVAECPINSSRHREKIAILKAEGPELAYVPFHLLYLVPGMYICTCMFLLVVFTSNRSFYPTSTAVHSAAELQCPSWLFILDSTNFVFRQQ